MTVELAAEPTLEFHQSDKTVSCSTLSMAARIGSHRHAFHFRSRTHRVSGLASRQKKSKPVKYRFILLSSFATAALSQASCGKHVALLPWTNVINVRWLLPMCLNRWRPWREGHVHGNGLSPWLVP